VLLALKVIVKERFVNPSGPGDLVYARSGEAELGKLMKCGGDDSGFGGDRVSFGLGWVLRGESFQLPPT
jgi:hypothetical protein